MTEKFTFSIRTKLLVVLLSAIILAALVFYIVFQLGNFFVWRYYLGENDKQERAEEYIEDFQKYVTKYRLSTDDTEMISAYNAGRYVDLIIYKDSNLIYAPEWFKDFSADELESDVGGDSTAIDEEMSETEAVSEPESPEGTELLTDNEEVPELVTDRSFYENWFSGDRGFERYLTEEARKDYRAALEGALGDDGALHPVYFVDGTLIVAVADFTEEGLENIVFAASIVSALAVIFVVMIFYFGRITNRIRLLQKNVRIIEEGDLDHKMVQSGNDEIALLSRDVGSMRDAIVENMTRERRAWEANAGLITAMSHDIRTPLTVLLGYLDLIEMQNKGDINEEYICACRDNALRLKNLSDDMFSYFLVFGRSDSELALSDVKIDELVGHIISEYTILLAERGYTVNGSESVPNGSVRIDERYFRRVMDNIFSNIIKYADTHFAVEIHASISNGVLTLLCKNKTRTDKNIPESNGIGLKTCSKMMEEMGGGLHYEEKDGFFTVKLTLLAEADNDKSDP